MFIELIFMKQCTKLVIAINVGLLLSSFMPSFNCKFHAREPFRGVGAELQYVVIFDCSKR